MLNIKNISDVMASFVSLEKQPQSAVKMLRCRQCAAVFSVGKQQRAYCPLCAGVVGYFLFLITTLHGDVASGMK
jgi:uncharacterized paraquat-inducible protein A